MIVAPLPVNETERLAALKSLDILDTGPEPGYDDFTLLASQICETPIALISLLDERRQWFKSRVGLDAPETPRDIAFCAHAIADPPDMLVVEDAAKDSRFSDNPLVAADPNIRFYAGAPLVTPENHALGTLCVIDRRPRSLDASQRAALRALARQLSVRLELRAAHLLLTRRNAELERLNAENNRFVGMAAHDLRNPLQAIGGYGKLMANGVIGPVTPEQAKALEAVTRNCSMMLSLVNDILSLSKVNAGELELEIRPADVAALVARNVDLNRLLAEAKDIAVELHVAPGLAQVSVDPFRIEQVLNNLIGNAVKFSHRGTVVKVSLERAGGGVKISVTDQGQGIPADELQRLFQPFSKTSVKGTEGEASTGLGLAISKRIVEAHGGTLDVESIFGEGSTFSFTLPGGGRVDRG